MVITAFGPIGTNNPQTCATGPIVPSRTGHRRRFYRHRTRRATIGTPGAERRSGSGNDNKLF